MEGFIVAITSLSMLVIVLIYFLKKPPKTCPKCGRFMYKDYSNDDNVLVCKECGHIEPKA
jgi:transposase